jgi:NAD(P)H-dependent FMN reductase
MGDEMNSTKLVQLIMGSTRAGRICPRITEWIAAIGQEQTGFDYQIIDLADWPLPMDDEPGIPAMGHYSQPHTRAWSDKVSQSDAVIFVTPQYNWGYPAVLKNAIDHLYAEWRDKPTVIVTYGGHGGGKCAEQLRQVAHAVKMRIVETAPAIKLPEAVIRQGASFDPATDFGEYVASIQNALNEMVAYVNAADAP